LRADLDGDLVRFVLRIDSDALGAIFSLFTGRAFKKNAVHERLRKPEVDTDNLLALGTAVDALVLKPATLDLH
jgi:hypothetical protein